MKELLAAFSDQFVIPVLRGTDSARALSVCQSLKDAGCRVFEVTLMSEEAYGVIEKLARDSNVIVGAGTVMRREQRARAIDSGAKFIVSPGFCPGLAENSPCPYIPGVATATEVMRAMAAGARFLKLFPARSMGGPVFLQDIRAPFPDIQWMPTGGVDRASLKAYREAGAHCVGAGSQLLAGADTEIAERFKAWRATSQVMP